MILKDGIFVICPVIDFVSDFSGEIPVPAMIVEPNWRESAILKWLMNQKKIIARMSNILYIIR